MHSGQENKPREKVLFICNRNSGRSQIAEALLRMLYPDRFAAYSAGLVPSQISPYVSRVMSQLGVDMSSQRSKSLDEYRGAEFDYVVTVCDAAKEACPFFPGRQVLHHSFSSARSEGSDQEILESFERVRDEIRTWLEEQFGGQKTDSGAK